MNRRVASPSRRVAIVGLVAVVVVAAAAAFLGLGRGGSAPTATPSGGDPSTGATVARATPPVVAAHVDDRQCLECHAPQAREWQGSHHAKAMSVASAGTVLGRFDGATFTHQGVTSRFFQRDGKFVVRTDGPDGKLADFEVAYTFGVSPLQQYLIAQPGGRLQALQIAWDDEKKRWFHLLPREKAPPGDILHWTGRSQNANTMCISCHTTAFEKRYDAAADRFDSRWKEVNVSCQSCHGPGEKHVAWARLRAEGRQAPEPAGTRFGLTAAMTKSTGPEQVQMCAQCHSRRSELTPVALPGRPLFDQHLPALLTEGLYHPDGQQLDEVFVYGSYRQSKMYQRGVACTDCHNPHTGKLKIEGNGVCLQCHAPTATPKFPAAAGLYDAPSHHFHQPGSSGALCVACHMPAKTYMQIQPRPDHSLRVPRPDLSVKLGVPNACTSCHTDKSARWAADQVAAWYGPNRRHGGPDAAPHYGEVFAAARAGQAGSQASLASLVADLKNPAIVRATALAMLRQDGATGMAQRVAATRDPDDAVRAAAADSLDAAPVAQRLYALGPLLTDPVRAVRIAAARALSTVPSAQMDPGLRPAFDAALDEYIAAQSLSLDMAGARLNLAVVQANRGRRDLAEQHYLAALKIDPDFTPARANLAQMYNGLGRNADAERVLREGLARQPGIGELQYSLGLLLAEEGRLPESAAELAKAAKLLPNRARVHYNLGLALQQLGRRPAAEQALLRAVQLDPEDPALAYALGVFYAQGGQRDRALEWAEKAVALAPADRQAAQLLGMLRRGN